jgi:integrase/recombinase XerD
VLAYRRDLVRFGNWCRERGICHLDEVTIAGLQDFAADMSQGTHTSRPLATSSLARTIVAVRGFWGFCVAEGLTAVDPASSWQPPSPPRRLPKALTYDQVEALLSAGAIGDGPVALRDVALLEFLYGTGARIDEACGLDRDDVDLAERTVLLRGKGGRQRLLPVGNSAVTALAAYFVRGRPALTKTSTPAVFLNSRGRRLSRQSAWGVVSSAADRAGLLVRVSPHTLRHSFATHLVERGADVRVVQELLGHASVTTTQIYTKVTVDTLREVYASSHPRARQTGASGEAFATGLG